MREELEQVTVTSNGNRGEELELVTVTGNENMKEELGQVTGTSNWHWKKARPVPVTSSSYKFQLLLLVTGYSVLFGMPLALYAGTPPANATELLNRISLYVINPVIFILFSAAFVVFIWGLVQFVANLDNEEARSTGAKHMIWGIVGMVVMVGVNSIVDIIQSTIKQVGS